MANFDVNNFDELKQAITDSKGNSAADTININSNITITGLLPLIEEDTSLTINGNRNTIDGNNQFRHFFVKSGNVVFDNLTFPRVWLKEEMALAVLLVWAARCLFMMGM